MNGQAFLAHALILMALVAAGIWSKARRTDIMSVVATARSVILGSMGLILGTAYGTALEGGGWMNVQFVVAIEAATLLYLMYRARTSSQ